MNKLFADSRKGMAVPVVLLIVLCVMVMTITLFHFRKQSKQQNVSNFHFLRVNFLAQSAIQHMLLKLSVFPQEAYDAGVLSLGYCPFRGIIFGNNNTVPPKGNSQNKEKGLKIFFEDCNTDEKSGGIKWVIDKERMKYARLRIGDSRSTNVPTGQANTVEAKLFWIFSDPRSLGGATNESRFCGQ